MAASPGTTFDVELHKIAARRGPGKFGVLTIDVEHDYDDAGSEALNRLPDLLAAGSRLGIPLTAFVEGRLFVERPDLCACLVEAGADLNLHCYDHRGPGDTADSLKAGIDAFGSFIGVAPRGYRAEGYRLTEEIFHALLAAGFAWDSSILPGIGLGARSDAVFRCGDWFLVDDALAEYPVASWRFGKRATIPFTGSYRQLLGLGAESLLNRIATLPEVVVYNMHMVDLVTDGQIGQSPLPLWMKGAHALARWRQRDFEQDLAAVAERLRRQGYHWTTMTALHALSMPNHTQSAGPGTVREQPPPPKMGGDPAGTDRYGTA